MTPIKQKELKPFKFPCGHCARLPLLGRSTRLAYWCSNPKYARRGTWRCGICIREHIRLRQKGLGSDGLRGWATILLRSLNYHAEKGRYTAPHISIDRLVDLRIQSKTCALTGRPLKWSDATLPHLHHNHVTGVVVGFVCGLANKAEGMLARLTKQERASLIQKAFPDEFDFGRDSE
jgi:hypothetical protein